MAQLINLYLFTFAKCHPADRCVHQNSLQRDTPVEWHSILARDLSFHVIVQSGINNKSYEFLRDHRKFIAACVVCLYVVFVTTDTISRNENSHRAVVNEVGSLND